MKRALSVSAVFIVSLNVILGTVCGCGGSGTVNEVPRPVKGSGKPTLLFFTQPGCPPCETVSPLVQELEQEMGDEVEFEEINISEDFESARKYGVQVTPTVVILDGDGSVVETLAGAKEKTVYRDALEELL